MNNIENCYLTAIHTHKIVKLFRKTVGTWPIRPKKIELKVKDIYGYFAIMRCNLKSQND